MYLHRRYICHGDLKGARTTERTWRRFIQLARHISHIRVDTSFDSGLIDNLKLLGKTYDTNPLFPNLRAITFEDPPSETLLRSASILMGQELRTLRLQLDGAPDEKFFVLLQTSSPSLSDVTLDMANLQGRDVVVVSNGLKALPLLMKVHIRALPDIRRSDLSLDATPFLEALYHHEFLEDLHLDTEFGRSPSWQADVADPFPSLKNLDMSWCPGSDHQFIRVISPTSCLRSLRAGGDGGIQTVTSVEAYLAAAGSFRELQDLALVGGSLNREPFSGSSLAPLAHCRAIQTISIDYRMEASITDADITSLVANLRDLRILWLKHWSSINGGLPTPTLQSLVTIVNACPKIRLIGLALEGTSGVDALPSAPPQHLEKVVVLAGRGPDDPRKVAVFLTRLSVRPLQFDVGNSVLPDHWSSWSTVRDLVPIVWKRRKTRQPQQREGGDN